jgi:hypothetical protein
MRGGKKIQEQMYTLWEKYTSYFYPDSFCISLSTVPARISVDIGLEYVGTIIVKIADEKLKLPGIE